MILLKICTKDIIITGHNLGSYIASYLYLLFVKRHLEDWGLLYKAQDKKLSILSSL